MYLIRLFCNYPGLYLRLIFRLIFVEKQLNRIYQIFLKPYSITRQWVDYYEIETIDRLLYTIPNAYWSDILWSCNPKNEFHLYPFFRVSSGSICLDIGAFAGKYSIYLGSQWARVFAFEPIKHSFEILQKNIVANKLENNITAINAALVSDSNIQHAVFSDDSSCSAMIVKEDKNIAEKEEVVECVSFQAFLKKYEIRKIDFIKIDTEWYEYPILKSMESFILEQQEPMTIVCEILRSQPDKHNIIEYLEKLGFHSYQRDVHNYIFTRK